MRDAPVFPPDLDPGLLPLLQLARSDLAFGRGAAGALERGKPLVYFALTSTVSALLRRSPPESASSFQSRLLSSYPAFPGESLGLLGRTTTTFQRCVPPWRRCPRDGQRLRLWCLVDGGGGGVMLSRPLMMWEAIGWSAILQRFLSGTTVGCWPVFGVLM